MRAGEAMDGALRAMSVCNACRYCEGYCAVFPALELRREFGPGDLAYLANLCHNCRACYYACQYAPPHEFGINLPRTFAELRAETYAHYAWPRGLARLFRRNGVVVSLAAALGIAGVLALTMLLRGPEQLFAAHAGPGAFYAVIPAWAMVSVASATFAFSLLALAMGTARFWRGTGGGSVPRARLSWNARPWLQALGDALTLRYLGGGGTGAEGNGGGAGCNDGDDRFSHARRRLHHAMFYGFLLCFASTCVAAIYEHVLGRLAPYPFLSPPVLLGALGGAGMVAGTGGLVWLKVAGDPAPAAPGPMGADFALLFLLLLTAATGLLLLTLRSTGAMGVLLAVHLGCVLAFFLVMPYSRFVHGPYRLAALLRHALERPAE